MNYLEQFLSEWYEYNGYFIRRNIKVGKRQRGGYAGELDIVAFNPDKYHLVHLEPSTDTDSWDTREKRYKKKFDLGRKYIPELFKGLKIPSTIDQRAIFLFGAKTREKIGDGKIFLMSEILKEIYEDLRNKRAAKGIVPENLGMIRTLHIFIDNLDKIMAINF